MKYLYKFFNGISCFVARSFLSIFDKDFKVKLKLADRTYMNIVDATYGKCNHFYNIEGNRIRGYEGRKYKFASVVEHPLLDKYR